MSLGAGIGLAMGVVHDDGRHYTPTNVELVDDNGDFELIDDNGDHAILED